jgi:hypothetical protein
MKLVTSGAGPAEPELLSAADLADLLGIAVSSAYRLARVIPSYKLPGVGLRFHRADVEAFTQAHRRDPAVGARPQCPARGVGMRLATADDDEEVLPGLTRRVLKEQAGF